MLVGRFPEKVTIDEPEAEREGVFGKRRFSVIVLHLPDNFSKTLVMGYRQRQQQPPIGKPKLVELIVQLIELLLKIRGSVEMSL
ncbi:MAG: hypothetical protein DI535_24805 [Citrobacter freundii]|nr:MAG: hypothetical protein DI535_24805 [Citrobacter freundii]